jgi:hypothetical protein
MNDGNICVRFGQQTYFTQTIIETVSMRDQFAMAALTGLISRAPDFMFPDLSQKAYRFADSMLEARKEKR